MKKLIALLSSLSLVGTAGVAGIATVACGSSSDKDHAYAKITALSDIPQNYQLTGDLASLNIIMLNKLKDKMGLSTSAEMMIALSKVMKVSLSIEFNVTPKSVSGKKAATKTLTLLPTGKDKGSLKYLSDNKFITDKKYIGAATIGSYNFIKNIKNVEFVKEYTNSGDTYSVGDKITFLQVTATVTVPTKSEVEAKLSTELATKINAGITAAKYQPGSVSAPIVINPDKVTKSPVDGLQFLVDTVDTVGATNPTASKMLFDVYNAQADSKNQLSWAIFKKVVYSVTVQDLDVLADPAHSKAAGDDIAVEAAFCSSADLSAANKEKVSAFQAFLKENGWDVDFDTIKKGTTTNYVTSADSNLKIAPAYATADWKEAGKKDSASALGFIDDKIQVTLTPTKTDLPATTGTNVINAILLNIGATIASEAIIESGDDEISDFLTIFAFNVNFVAKGTTPSGPALTPTTAKDTITGDTGRKSLNGTISVQEFDSSKLQTQIGHKIALWLYQQGVTNGAAMKTASQTISFKLVWLKPKTNF